MLGIPHHISAGDLSPALRSGLGANRVPLHDLDSQPLPGRRRADRPFSVHVRTGADAQCGRGGQEAELRVTADKILIIGKATNTTWS